MARAGASGPSILASNAALAASLNPRSHSCTSADSGPQFTAPEMIRQPGGCAGSVYSAAVSINSRRIASRPVVSSASARVLNAPCVSL
ncbi:hypothetical protein [Nonomuraea dietziae]|uniref:hypothetical protein n=1 Tax=Nonomuraea dietziae TaxID=65515 RepID=UPI0031D1C79E